MFLPEGSRYAIPIPQPLVPYLKSKIIAENPNLSTTQIGNKMSIQAPGHPLGQTFPTISPFRGIQLADGNQVPEYILFDPYKQTLDVTIAFSKLEFKTNKFFISDEVYPVLEITIPSNQILYTDPPNNRITNESSIIQKWQADNQGMIATPLYNPTKRATEYIFLWIIKQTNIN